MTSSEEFGSGVGLDMHIRTEIVSGWSLISNAALRIGDDVFELANDGSYYINQVPNVELPFTMAGKYVVTKQADIFDEKRNTTESSFEIDLSNDESIAVSLFKGMISVRIDAAIGDAEGMLGIHGKSGMIGRDRETVLVDQDEMGFQWQVTAVEPMLFHDVRAPQYPERCTLPAVPSRRLREYSDEDIRLAADACAGVTEETRQFCLDDVLLTGDYNLGRRSAYLF